MGFNQKRRIWEGITIALVAATSPHDPNIVATTEEEEYIVVTPLAIEYPLVLIEEEGPSVATLQKESNPNIDLISGKLAMKRIIVYWKRSPYVSGKNMTCNTLIATKPMMLHKNK